jgi:uncharacterized membrane protein (GlpM family)
MPADFPFWYELALKMAFTAAIVVAASVVAERSGPFFGAVIASLPTAAGAAYIILAIEHPPEFIATSAVGSMAANATVAIFAYVYTVLAQRHGMAHSLGAAMLVWFGCAAALQMVTWTPVTAIALDVAVFGFTIVASHRYLTAMPPGHAVKRTYLDIPMRALAAALVVAIVTTASHRIGSFMSGTFAVFPIVMSSLVVVLHPRIGGPATASVFAHAQVPLVGLALGFLAVHYLAMPAGEWWALLAGLVVSMAWNTVLWALRRRTA